MYWDNRLKAILLNYVKLPNNAFQKLFYVCLHIIFYVCKIRYHVKGNINEYFSYNSSTVLCFKMCLFEENKQKWCKREFRTDYSPQTKKYKWNRINWFLFNNFYHQVFKIENEKYSPRIDLLKAQTSMVAFIQELIRQWYWKIFFLGSKLKDPEHCWRMELQFISSALICQDSASLGQWCPYLTVRIDFWQAANAAALKKQRNNQIMFNAYQTQKLNSTCES